MDMLSISKVPPSLGLSIGMHGIPSGHGTESKTEKTVGEKRPKTVDFPSVVAGGPHIYALEVLIRPRNAVLANL